MSKYLKKGKISFFELLSIWIRNTKLFNDSKNVLAAFLVITDDLIAQQALNKNAHQSHQAFLLSAILDPFAIVYALADVEVQKLWG